MAYNTPVYGPMSSGQGGPFVSQKILGSTSSPQVGITSAVHTANVPGVDLRQVTEVNGVAMDVGRPSRPVSTAIRTVNLRK